MSRGVPSPPKPKASDADVGRAIASGAGGIDSGMLLKELIDCFGGPTQFARDIFKEYQGGKQGGMTRQKILEMISRLTIVVTNQQIARPARPEDMSDDELIAAAGLLLERVHRERPPAAPEPPPGPAPEPEAAPRPARRPRRPG